MYIRKLVSKMNIVNFENYNIKIYIYIYNEFNYISLINRK